MFKLLKFSKRYLLPMLIVLALLIVGAFCDLALPSYTSDIVNIGIQQSGIESSAPEVLSTQTYALLASCLPAEDADLLSAYTLSSDPSALPGAMQNIEPDEFYQLGDLSEEQRLFLESRLVQPILLCMVLSGDMSEDASYAELLGGELDLPEGVSLQQLFSSLGKRRSKLF